MVKDGFSSSCAYLPVELVGLFAVARRFIRIVLCATALVYVTNWYVIKSFRVSYGPLIWI